MRSIMVAVFVLCLGVSLIGTALAQWTEAKIPGEQNRTAQGCAAEPRNDWVCILVRCDQPGAPPGLYFSTGGPELKGKIKLAVDDESFAVSVPAAPSPLAFSTRAGAASAELLEALKSGASLSIEGTYLKPPNNVISLQNSRSAIERVEQMCTRGRVGGNGLWRHFMRSFASSN